jgi:glycosyltransferase involved in cell wall biosynthesis
MPTRNRPQYAPLAVTCFKRQTYPSRELIILDDADAPSLGLLAKTLLKSDGVIYDRLSTRMTIAEKRNACCSMASGDVIVHWDDDD